MTQINHIIVDDPNVVPTEQALAEAFASLGLETLGGASGKGWSRYAVLQACPKKFELRHVHKIQSEDRAALSVGSLFHAFLAIYYTGIINLLAGKDQGPTASSLREAVLSAGADAEFVIEAWRVFDAYATHYEGIGDYLRPLAVEYLARDTKTGRTCRYDLIAEVPKEVGLEIGITPGIYNCEHKSHAYINETLTEGYHLDGEIIGQVMLWKKAGLHKTFGKLQGVIVNIASKTKVPKMHREIVVPPLAHTKRQAKDLDYWDHVEQGYRLAGHWPRSLQSCNGKYGLCEFYDHCRSGRKKP